MTRTKISSNDGQKDFKPSPNLDLRGAVGNKVIGTVKGRIESKMFEGKFSTIIAVEETNGSTTLYDKATQSNNEVEIEQGDTVFLNENSVLARSLSKVEAGTRIEIVYLGKGKAQKGRKAPFIYDVFKLED